VPPQSPAELDYSRLTRRARWTLAHVAGPIAEDGLT
jgi:hypothetical protein